MIDISRTPESNIKLNICGFNIIINPEAATELKNTLTKFLAFPTGPKSGTILCNSAALPALHKWHAGLTSWEEFCYNINSLEVYWLDPSKQLWKLNPQTGTFTLYNNPLNILAWITRRTTPGNFLTL